MITPVLIGDIKNVDVVISIIVEILLDGRQKNNVFVCKRDDLEYIIWCFIREQYDNKFKIGS